MKEALRRVRHFPTFFCEFLPLLAVTLYVRMAMYLVADGQSNKLSLSVAVKGGLSDALVVFCLALLFCLTRNLYVRFIAGIIWCFFLAGNLEFIHEKGANLDLGQIGQGTSAVFITGSILISSVAEKFQHISLRYLLFWPLAYVLLSERPVRLKRWLSAKLCPHVCPHCLDIVLNFGKALPSRGIGIVLVLIVSLHAAMPAMPLTIPNWRSYNVLEEWMLGLIARHEHLPKGFGLLGGSQISIFYKRDLDAPLRVVPVGDGAARPNILVIVIESLSHEQLQRGWLPNLQALVPRSFYYPNFIAPTAMTVNGLYALFCGDYPTFTFENDGTVINGSNSTVLLNHGLWGKRQCLPEVLNQNGYNTVFWEAAPLDFANKKEQLPKMGFMETKGGVQLQTDAWGWGLDDAALLAKIEEKMGVLDAVQPKKPWLLAMLTVGTHHPYDKVPADFMPSTERRERSYRYMDKVLGEFIGGLDEKARRNTLIVIAGDESGEQTNEYPLVNKFLSRNRGFMMVLLPSGDQAIISQAYSQIDMQISLLDYLGIDNAGSYGRSLFRDYQSFRPMVLENIIQRRVTFFPSPTERTTCNTLDWRCSDYVLKSGTMFDAPVFSEVKASSPDRAQALKDFVRFNQERTQ